MMEKSCPRFYCCPITRPECTVTGSEARHMSRVLRLGEGDRVELFDGGGGVAAGRICRVEGGAVTLEIGDFTFCEAPQAGRVVIASAIAKADRFEWLISKTTELGVDGLIPTVFERSVKVPGKKNITERYRQLAIAAAKQCGRIFLPEISSPQALPAVLSDVRGRFPDALLLLGRVESAAPSAAEVLAGSGQLMENSPSMSGPLGDTVVFVGPEGGLTEGESGMLLEVGARPVRLTRTTLRIETAAVAFAALLCTHRDRYGPIPEARSE